MKSIKGFSQTRLNEIWDSLSSSNPNISASIKVDDEHEQVMTVNTDKDGQISVSREPEGNWKEL